MKLIHTSPEPIKTIHEYGLLGENLCFAAGEYVTTAKTEYFVYALKIDEDKIIDQRDLDDDEIVQEIAERFGVDEDIAERLLDGRENPWNHGGEAEEAWWLQRKQGDCAKKMGFRGVESTDEQGTVWIVPMLGREQELYLASKRCLS